jgi:hypothetical protein
VCVAGIPLSHKAGSPNLTEISFEGLKAHSELSIILCLVKKGSMLQIWRFWEVM